MKHNKIALAAALVLGLGAAGSASADQGLITFVGSVSDGTCVVSGGTGTNGGVGNFTVPIDPVLSTDFTRANQPLGLTQFNINISKDGNGAPCSGLQNGNAEFGFVTSSPNVNVAGRLKNVTTAAQGGATNVELQLLDDTGTAINLSQPKTWTVTGLDTQAATLTYGVEYYSTNANVGAGGVRSDVIYNVTYN
ncbi:hypothetical protein [Dyella sp.]|uniref:fimbrial protein n=1 Tax=Dyella sp. TaxID=1869338 RepID=UPI002B4A2A14|nr:hypothetical protein [Dyella sp.]HKT27453.1 hypothetical protein [Dyella sp.]